MKAEPRAHEPHRVRRTWVLRPGLLGLVPLIFVAMFPVAGLCSVLGHLYTDEKVPVPGGIMIFISGRVQPIECAVGVKGDFSLDSLSRGEVYDVKYLTVEAEELSMRQSWTYPGGPTCFAISYGELIPTDCPAPPPPDRVGLFVGVGSIAGKTFNGVGYRIDGADYGNDIQHGVVVGGECYLPASILPSVESDYVRFVMGLAYLANVYDVRNRTNDGSSDVTYRRYVLRIGCSYLPGWGGLGLGGGLVLGRGGFYDGSEKLMLLGENFDLSTYGAYLSISYGHKLGGFTTALRLEPSVAKANDNHSQEFNDANDFWNSEIWSWSMVLVISR